MINFILPVLLFCFSTTITPGPNNIMATASGINFGYKKTLPHILGITVGIPVMVIGVGFGIGSLFKAYPILYKILQYTGSAYLLFLSWKIATFQKLGEKTEKGKPLSFWYALTFQWINPKVWVMVTGAISTFTTDADKIYSETLIIALTFFIVCFPSVSVWALFGAKLKTFLKTDRYRKIFNISVALLLVSSLLLNFIF
jgi:threonine/homoserine/homoserine lactone efflux protein